MYFRIKPFRLIAHFFTVDRRTHDSVRADRLGLCAVRGADAARVPIGCLHWFAESRLGVCAESGVVRPVRALHERCAQHRPLPRRFPFPCDQTGVHANRSGGLYAVLGHWAGESARSDQLSGVLCVQFRHTNAAIVCCQLAI